MMDFTLHGLYDPQKRWWSEPNARRPYTGDQQKQAAFRERAAFLARYADGKSHKYLVGHTVTAYRFLNPTEFQVSWEHYFTRSSLERENLFEIDLGLLLQQGQPFPDNEFLSVCSRNMRYGRGYEIQLHAPTPEKIFGFRITQREVIDDLVREKLTHTFTPAFDKSTKNFLKYSDAPGEF